MSPQDGASQEPARAFFDAWRKRFPARGRAALVIDLVGIVIANGVIVGLLASGRLSTVGLMLLIATECLVLLVLGRVATAWVPREHWLEPPPALGHLVALLAFLAVWGGIVYGVALTMLEAWPEFIAFFRSLEPWIASGIVYALGISLLLALIDHAVDWQHYRRHGPPFVSGAGMHGAARMLTLILGGIPVAVPAFAALFGSYQTVEFVVRHGRASPRTAALAIAALVGGLSGLGILVWCLINLGVHPWAVGFLLGKISAESLLLWVSQAGK